MLRSSATLAEVTKDDIVYDLGCGDGRIVITAALTYGARGVGHAFDLPIATSSTAEGRAMNRRVVIVMLDRVPSE